MAYSERLYQQYHQFVRDNRCVEALDRCDKIKKEKENDNRVTILYLIRDTEESDETRTESEDDEDDDNFTAITTWIGLDNYDEDWEDPERSIDLLPIYNELLKLKISNEKVLDIMSTIAERGFKQNDIKTVHIVVHHLGEEPTIKIYVGINDDVEDIVNTAITFSDDDSEIMESYLSQNDLDENVYNSLCILWGQIIFKNNIPLEALEEVMRLSFFRSNAVFRDWLCKHICSMFITDESLGNIALDSHMPVITEGISEQKYPQLLLAVSFYKKKDYLESYKICRNVINFDIPSTFEVTFVLKCSVILRMWASVEVLSQKFISEARNRTNVIKLIKFLFLSFVNQKKFAKALEVSRELSIDSLDISELVLLARCHIENGDNPKTIMNIIRPMSTQLYAQLKALTYLKKKRYIDVLTTLDRNVVDPVSYFYIAKSYWHLGEFHMCYNFLMKAVAHDTEYADAYHLLGVYYENFALKPATAIDYFEKAVKCNGADHDIVKSLSDMYLLYSVDTENFTLLTRAYHYVGRKSWVNFRLGLYHFDRNNWTEAALKFLRAIEYSTETDAKCHEFLARSYQLLGLNERAVGVIRDLIRLRPEDTNNYLCFIGNIYADNDRFYDALQAYEEAFATEADYLPALKSTAQTWLKIGHQQLRHRQYSNARKAAQVTVEYTIYMLDVASENWCYWEELAKALTFIASLPDEHCFVEVPFDKDDDLGNLGYIYVKRNVYKLIYYCSWRSKSVLPPLLDRLIGRKIASEILSDETAARQAADDNNQGARANPAPWI